MKTLITGPAGSGKTTMIKKIILKNKYKFTAVLAPTHQALNVLKEKIGDKNNRVVFMTVHSALNAVPSIHGFDKLYIPKDVNLKKLRRFGRVIVDEASMIESRLAELLYKYDKELYIVGDPYQLPPVHETTSKLFNMKYNKHIHLDKIHRQQAGTVIEKIAKNPENTEKLLLKEDGNIVHTKNINEVIEAVMRGSVYLAYHNRKVDHINNIVKQALGIEEEYARGMNIVFDTNYKQKYYTNQRVRIFKVVKSERKIIHGSTEYIIPVWELNNDIVTVAKEGTDTYYKLLSEAIKDNNLITYHRLIDIFAWLKYTWAMTVHKSQGSTFDKVVIDYYDLKQAEEEIRDPLFYVAATRAKYKDLVYFDEYEKNRVENNRKNKS